MCSSVNSLSKNDVLVSPIGVPRLVKENNPVEPGEVDAQLRAPATPPGGLSSILSTHMLALVNPMGTCTHTVHINSCKHTCINKYNKHILKKEKSSIAFEPAKFDNFKKNNCVRFEHFEKCKRAISSL